MTEKELFDIPDVKGFITSTELLLECLRDDFIMLSMLDKSELCANAIEEINDFLSQPLMEGAREYYRFKEIDNAG